MNNMDWNELNNDAGVMPNRVQFPEQSENPPTTAPFNFVPFSDYVIYRYFENKSLPELCPMNSSGGSVFSGRIDIRITAQTPIFVSDRKNRFQWNNEGRCCIPGTTLRGLLRSNMDILGFGGIAERRHYAQKIDNTKGRSIVDYIPEEVKLLSHKNMEQDANGQSSQKVRIIDYTDGIMGFVDNNYRRASRVRIEDFSTDGKVQFQKDAGFQICTPTVRMPLCTYLRGDTIPGRKQYWHKSVTKSSTKKTGNSVRLFYPAVAGTTFRGSIHYDNLYADELGLLLWCIRLEENCFQSIGYAKSQGYGRVKIEIEKLMEFNPEKAYQKLDYCMDQAADNRIGELIKHYQETAQRLLKLPDSIMRLPEIQTFISMKKLIVQGDQAKAIVSAPGIRNYSRLGTLPDAMTVARQISEAEKV